MLWKVTKLFDFHTAWEAFQEGDIDELERLAVGNTFPHGVDGWLGRRWLTNAIDAANAYSVEWVLSKGVDCNYVDDEGFSALKSALQVERGCKRSPNAPSGAELTISLIDLLLGAGADVNARITLGYTALHAAASWSSVKVVQHLLARGADPSAIAYDYESIAPADLAKFHKRWEVHSVLVAAMEKVSDQN